METRICVIESAEIGSKGANEDVVWHDGAYDLFDVCGTPDEIGKAIAESLKTSDLFGGHNCDSTIESGSDLFLGLRIRFCKPMASAS